jgi:hypothetical protein
MDEQVVEYLQGYARADEYLERERMIRLSQLSVEESWEIFSALVESQQDLDLTGESQAAYMAWRLETLIAVRQAFYKLAQAKGWI